MKITIKSALLLFLALLACFIVFTACNGDGGPTDPIETPDETPEHICSFGQWEQDDEASCTQPGALLRACSCGETETEIIYPTGHIIVNDVCTVCQAAVEPEFWHFNEDDITADHTNKKFYTPLLFFGYADRDHSRGYLDVIMPSTAESAGITVNPGNYWDCTPVLSPYVSEKILSKDHTDAGDTLFSITLASNITKIESCAFSGCSRLYFVQIPASVTQIGDDVFLDCPALEYIVFGGTAEQWNLIEKGSNWDKSSGNYVVICSDGVIEKEA